MSSSLTFSTSDLRSHAVLHKRNAAQKHKWALGATETVTRTGRPPRPFRPSETEFNARRRKIKAALAEEKPSVKIARRHDILEGTLIDKTGANSTSEYDELPSPPVDNKVAYLFDATHPTSNGTSILNAALAKAVAKYEERETINLVQSEYDVLDTDGEVVAPVASKRRRQPASKAQAQVSRLDVEDDYELV